MIFAMSAFPGVFAIESWDAVSTQQLDSSRGGRGSGSPEWTRPYAPAQAGSHLAAAAMLSKPLTLELLFTEPLPGRRASWALVTCQKVPDGGDFIL